MSFIMTTLKGQDGKTLTDEYGNAVYDSPRLILDGKKTQTRRLWKPGMRLVEENGVKVVYNPPTTKYPHGTRKWVVGREYCVTPKRSMPTVWYRPHAVTPGVMGETPGYDLAHDTLYPKTTWLDFAHDTLYTNITWLDFAKDSTSNWVNAQHYLELRGFDPLKIRVLDLEKQVLGDITRPDCWCEGVATRLGRNDDSCNYNYITREYQNIKTLDVKKCYKTLLEATNGGKPVAWDTEVCKITFEVVL